MAPELAASMARAYRRAAALPDTSRREHARWTEAAEELEAIAARSAS